MAESTKTMTLTDFLLARIAEDEDRARLDGVHWMDCEHFVAFSEGGLPCTCGLKGRVLAECEAKRRIVELSWHHLGDEDYGWGMEEAKRQILALLALPYADHPDYDEAWRP